jgi:hypothetical protein
VCTYDDFDSDYDAPLAPVGGEMVAGTGRGYRTHGAHGRGHHSSHAVARETSAAAQEVAGSKREERTDNFGPGILSDGSTTRGPRRPGAGGGLCMSQYRRPGVAAHRAVAAGRKRPDPQTNPPTDWHLLLFREGLRPLRGY